MSSTVKSYGFVAVLDDPIPEDEQEDLQELLYESKSKLQINNEGTLVYMDFNLHEPYSVREDIYGLILGECTKEGRARFTKAVHAADLTITVGTIQPYDEIWYNGSDSVISCLTKEKYLSTF